MPSAKVFFPLKSTSITYNILAAYYKYKTLSDCAEQQHTDSIDKTLIPLLMQAYLTPISIVASGCANQRQIELTLRHLLTLYRCRHPQTVCAACKVQLKRQYNNKTTRHDCYNPRHAALDACYSYQDQRYPRRREAVARSYLGRQGTSRAVKASCSKGRHLIDLYRCSSTGAKALQDSS